jgi:DNA-binding NtrC family response regulator
MSESHKGEDVMKSHSQLRRALVIEDEVDIRDTLVQIIEEQNLEVRQAQDGQQALDLVKKESFQVIISDIHMPHMDGLQFLAACRTAGVHTPLIFLTGFSDKDRMLQAIRLGAVDFIGKPFEVEEVLDVLFRVLEMGSRREKIEHSLNEVDPEVSNEIRREEKMMTLLRVSNNRNRTGT